MGPLPALAVNLRTLTLGVPVSIALTVGLIPLASSSERCSRWPVLLLALQKIGIDPAAFTLPMITTIMDGAGLVVCSMLARVLLGLA